MRILHLSDRLSARGGADLNLLAVLARQAGRHRLHLAVGRDDGSTQAPCRVTVISALAATRAETAEAALERLAARLRPDLIHVHNCMNPGVLAWAADHGAVMTVQDHRTFCPGRGKLTLGQSPCREPMGRAVCTDCFTDRTYFEAIYEITAARLAAVRRMGSVVVLSRYMKDELVVAGVEAQRIAVVPPFVHGLDTHAPSSGPPCVLFAGRLVEAKGVLDAVEAYRRSGVELPLVFAGTGSARVVLEATGCELLGWVPHAKMAGVYKRARALVMPSRWQEPFGIAGLEALSLGVPVVAWDSGGVGEWLHEVTPWGDVDALSRALRVAVDGGDADGTDDPDDPMVRRAHPPAGFEPETAMARLEAVYEQRCSRI